MVTVKHYSQALALAGLLLSGGVQAADTGAPAPAPTPGVEAAPGTETKIFDEKPWVFDPRGRRDPFSFAFKPKVAEEPTFDPKNPTNFDNKPEIDPKLIIQKKQEAEAFYAEAERTFLEVGMEGKALEVVAKCDGGLKVFADTPNAGAIQEWQPVRARLENLRKASERMKARHDAKKKFEETNIRLTGVVARERRSQAIINGRTVGKGDIVTAADNYEVAVDDIQADQVVFVTPEGYKVKLTWSELTK